MPYKVIGMLRNGGLGKDLNDSGNTEYKSQLQNRGQFVVPYMSEDERAKYLIKFKNKKVCDVDEAPLQTKREGGGGGFFIFVMTAEGQIYSAAKNVVHHHSSFMSGRPVAAAGCWVVEAGVVKLINNQSGHYCPTKDFLEQFADELEKQGIDLSTTEKKFGADSAIVTANAKRRNTPLTKVIDYLPGTEKSKKPVKIGEHYAGQCQRLYTPQPPRWEWF